MIKKQKIFICFYCFTISDEFTEESQQSLNFYMKSILDKSIFNDLYWFDSKIVLKMKNLFLQSIQLKKGKK